MIVLPIGPGWGSVQTLGAETFTVPDLPAGPIFYGFQPTYALGSTLTIYSNGELAAVRQWTTEQEWSAVTGKLPHSGGDLTFVCEPATGQPYNVYALGWAHSDLDLDPLHWQEVDYAWKITRSSPLPILAASTAETFYGPGVPTTSTGLGPRLPIDEAAEDANYALLLRNDQNVTGPNPGGSCPSAARRSFADGFVYRRKASATATQGITEVSAPLFASLPVAPQPLTQEYLHTSFYSTSLWGEVNRGVAEYKVPRLLISACSETPELLGTLDIRHCADGGYEGGNSGNTAWMTPEELDTHELLFSQEYVSTLPGPQAAPPTVVEWPNYEDYRDTRIYAPGRIRLSFTSTVIQSGVYPVDMALGTTSYGAFSETTSQGYSSHTAKVALELEYKSPHRSIFRGFPLLAGILKVRIEDASRPAPFWTVVGTGRGWQALKLVTGAGTGSTERNRVDTRAALPLYIMTAEGWRKTAYMIPPAPPEPPPPEEPPPGAV